jgi:hypothetical protein
LCNLLLQVQDSLNDARTHLPTPPPMPPLMATSSSSSSSSTSTVASTEAVAFPLRRLTLKRLDVAFDMAPGRSLDKAIGRAAHILFLDDPAYMLMFLVLYRDLLFM